MTRQEIKRNAKAALGNGIFTNNWMYAVLAILIVGAVTGISSVVPIATIIITGPLALSMAYVFLKMSDTHQPLDFKDLLKGFTDDFVQNLLLGFMSTLFIALWSLLLIIPGIVKTYAYSMAYYIKVDHPEYGWKQCLDESQKMMQGKKMDLFILDLSFIGWMIVGSLCLGVGTLWVAAYMSSARAEFYKANKVVGF